MTTLHCLQADRYIPTEGDRGLKSLHSLLDSNRAPAVKPSTASGFYTHLLHFCSVTYDPGTTKRQPSLSDVREVEGLTLDVDKITWAQFAKFRENLEAMGWGGVLYTTHSHTEADPHYRFVTLWSVPVGLKVHSDAWAYLRSKLGEFLPRGQGNPNRGAFAPPPGSRVELIKGELPDATALAAKYVPPPRVISCVTGGHHGTLTLSDDQVTRVAAITGPGHENKNLIYAMAGALLSEMVCPEFIGTHAPELFEGVLSVSSEDTQTEYSRDVARALRHHGREGQRTLGWPLLRSRYPEVHAQLSAVTDELKTEDEFLSKMFDRLSQKHERVEKVLARQGDIPRDLPVGKKVGILAKKVLQGGASVAEQRQLAGWYLRHAKEASFEAIANHTGIPTEEIAEAAGELLEAQQRAQAVAEIKTKTGIITYPAELPSRGAACIAGIVLDQLKDRLRLDGKQWYLRRLDNHLVEPISEQVLKQMLFGFDDIPFAEGVDLEDGAKAYKSNAAHRAEILERLAVHLEEPGWAKDAPEGVGYQNGFLTFPQGEFIPLEEAKCQKVFDVDYTPETPHDIDNLRAFEAWADSVFPNDDKALQLWLEHVGFLFSSPTDRDPQQAVVWQSGSGTGKSTWVKLFSQILGKKWCTFDANKLGRSNFALGRISGAQVLCCSEFIAPKRNVEEFATTVQQLTSREMVEIERKGQDADDLVWQGRVFLCTNTLDELRDPGGALVPRLSVLHLQGAFRDTAQQDMNLLTKLKAELPYILPLALEAYQFALGSGRFTRPPSGQAVRDAVEAQANPFRLLIEDAVILDPEGTLDLAALRDDLVVQIQEDHPGRYRDGVPLAHISKELRKSFPEAIGTRMRVQGKRSTVFTGIRLRTLKDAD